MSDKHECGCDHDWKYIRDWYGDPEVVGGTADFSRWVCQTCGAEDNDRAAPLEDYSDDR